MRVLLVTGIWPPDIGGPATHMPEVANFLLARGHTVSVLTTASSPPDEQPYPVDWVARSLPPGVRHLALAARIAHSARSTDVVYATSVPTRAAVGTRLAGAPLVLKLTTDDAFERAFRFGWFTETMDDFQGARGVRFQALRAVRNAALRRARTVICPSSYLAELVAAWGVDPGRVTVIPNAGPGVDELPTREEARGRVGIDGTVFAFAGRITAQKALDVALDALACAPQVTLLVIGDGPDRPAVEAHASELGLGPRVRFLGACPHDRVVEILRAADALLLSSDWENAPHGVVESLTVGTPVVATAVGGVAELVQDGVNGLLVPARDPVALAAAIQRIADEPGLRDKLAVHAARSVTAYAPERVLERVAHSLEKVNERS